VHSSINATLKNASLAVQTVIDTPDLSFSSNQQATPVSVASLPAIVQPSFGATSAPLSPIALLGSPDSDEKVDESMISGVSTQQTTESDVMQDFYANMRRNMYPEEHLTSWDVQTVASYRTSATGFASMQAQVNRPIPTRTIVSLKEIKQKMGKRAELFSTNSMYGFDRERWKTSLQKKFPIDMSAGFKKLIGPNIKTAYDRKLKSITFSFRRKATPSQINSLIGYVESLVPPFNELRIERKRRVWEEIYDIKSIQDLTEYIQRVKNDVARTFMKISWK